MENNVPKSTVSHGYRIWSHDSDGNLFYGNCNLLYQYKYHSCTIDSIMPEPTVLANPKYSVVKSGRPAWQYGANLSGGSQAIRYYVSGNYDTQFGAISLPKAMVDYLQANKIRGAVSDAVRNPNTMRTISSRGTFSANVGTKGDVGMVVGYTQTMHRAVDMSLVDTQDGLLDFWKDTTTAATYFGGRESIFLRTSSEESSRTNASMNGTWRFTPGLSVRGSLGIDLAPSVTHQVRPAQQAFPNDRGYAADSRRGNAGRTFDVGATSLARASVWSFRSSVGAQYNYSHTDGINVTATGLTPGSSSIGTASNFNVQQIWAEQASLGGYGEEVFGLRDRLFLTGSLRVDGSTSFGDAYHPTPYPKLGLSWIASDEPFLQGVPGLTELRIRVSTGSAAKYPTSVMKFGHLYADQKNVDGTYRLAYSRDVYANPDLRPERTRETEWGADATLLSNVRLGLTWYARKTRDELIEQQNSTGLLQRWENLGLITAHGFEGTATASIVNTPMIRADLNFTYSHTANKLVSLGNLRDTVHSWSGSTILVGYAEGYPLESLYGFPILGVLDTVGDGVGHGHDGIVFPEEIVRDTVQRFLGVLFPPHTFTLTPTVALWGSRVRISSVIDRQTGFVVQDVQAQNCIYRLTCLTPFNPHAPLLAQAQMVARQYEDFVVPGDFTRWRELTLSVDVPRRLLGLNLLHLGFSSATVSLQGRNLAIHTAFKGTDPESRQLYTEAAVNGLPQTRTWAFRFDINP